MSEAASEGPSLIKLGKLANMKQFDKLEELWPEALESPDYSWRELLPIAGQVGRQGAPDRADGLMDALVGRLQEKRGPAAALEAVRTAAVQLPGGPGVRRLVRRLYAANAGDFPDYGDLAELLLAEDKPLDKGVLLLDLYLQLKPGSFAVDRGQLVPGVVEAVAADRGVVSVRFGDRVVDYGMATLDRLSPRSDSFFPALVLYAPERLRALATSDPVAFVNLALDSNRDERIAYRDLKGWVVGLMGEKGWKDWWVEAKAALKRDPLIGLGAGSQPELRRLRQADRFEDRLRREFDHRKDPQDKLLKVAGYLDEIAREKKQRGTGQPADPELLLYLGNGAAKIAVAVLGERPALSLAGLALHAEVAALGVEVARPNPRAAGQVLAKVGDPAQMVEALPEALVVRVLNYLQQSMPDDWGRVWSSVLMRAGRRLCDSITRGLIEGGQGESLAAALQQAMLRPTASPDLVCWMWRSRFTGGTGGRFLEQQQGLPVRAIADAMLSLLDSVGKLYGMSMEERHLKTLEMARQTMTTQSSKPLLDLLELADRDEAIRFKRVIEGNGGLSPAHRTQLLGFLRARHADIFVEAARDWADRSVIYTTEAGLKRQHATLKHIIEEEIPAVAKQIGEAASFGDLSENAEYTAALEKRDQLASTATRLESELAQARVISPDMAAGDFVNVGTHVTVRNDATGGEELYTFLGPWDTDTANRVLNYQAPVAQAFMGKKVGEAVSYGEGEDRRSWVILAIESALS
ncbi:MAG TPA: GreA/GreB family elongation factor [Candidatus Krumholzibacteria bacterium]|nr:GreA/GreB family elongation factor [Candidatus Krumholzibacteria bacterium]